MRGKSHWKEVRVAVFYGYNGNATEALEALGRAGLVIELSAYLVRSSTAFHHDHSSTRALCILRRFVVPQ